MAYYVLIQSYVYWHWEINQHYIIFLQTTSLHCCSCSAKATNLPIKYQSLFLFCCAMSLKASLGTLESELNSPAECSMTQVCVCFEHLLSSNNPCDLGMKLINCPSRARRDENKASQINNPVFKRNITKSSGLISKDYSISCLCLWIIARNMKIW